MSGEMLQDRVQSKCQVTEIRENYVRGHGTNEITCQVTCHKGKIEDLCQAT